MLFTYSCERHSQNSKFKVDHGKADNGGHSQSSVECFMASAFYYRNHNTYSTVTVYEEKEV